MNEILAQARAQWSAAAKQCRTELATAEQQLAETQAAAAANADVVSRQNKLLAASMTRRKNPEGGIMVDNFEFVPEPEPPRSRHTRPDYDEDEGPVVTRQDSW
jgi:hypothetical protein